jgi:hypothetical protein
MRKYIYGADTETLEGAPMTFQFFSELPACADLLWVDPNDATRTFLRWCRSLPTKAQHVVYIHNLEFDLVSLFWDRKAELIKTSDGEFAFVVDGWRISGVYGAPTYARVTDRGSTRSIMLIDSYSYYRASLAKAAEVFCPGLPKLKRPEGLGKKRFAKNDETFAVYAMRDAEVAYHIGIALERLHDEFDLTQTVSVADMAARIFRHRFMQHAIPQPDRPVIEAALHAYHGGKNNLAVSPGWHLGVSALDISSAYPHAMREFPSFSVSTAYRRFKAFRVKSVPPLGVYQINGHVAQCAWPSLYSHGFKPLSGGVEGVWVSGYELNEALQAGELTRLQSVVGWYYDVERDRHFAPLRAFVDEFYARKEKETDKGRRTMYKFILNSISGKFIQTLKRKKVTHVDIDSGAITESGDLIAGGMFHPFIAQLITGHTRARIHALEHQYEALHTATDGIFTRKSVRSEDKGLGALVCEARGDLLLLRNKLYILYSDEGETPSYTFEGRRIAKYALHGFAGSVTDLEQLVVSNRRRYQAVRVNRLRDSLKRGLVPNEFATRDFILKIGDLPVHG